jgi:hypothetical protein
MSVSFARATALSVAFCAVSLAPALAQNVAIPEQVFKTGATTVTLRGVAVAGSSASQADVVKMLSPQTPAVERAALLKTFKASKFAIPTVEVKDEKVTVTIRDMVAEGIDAGKVSRLGVAGAEGSGDKGLKFKVRPLTAENGDLTPLLTALTTGDFGSAAPRFAGFKSDGFEASFMEDGPKERAGRIDLSLASMEGKNVMAGDVFTSGTFVMKNLVVIPEKTGKMGRDLAAFGYDKLDIGMTSSAAYDQATKALKIDDFSITGVGAGALTLKGALGGVEKSFASSDRNAMLAAFIGADVSMLELKYVDSGLFDKALAYAAGKSDPKTVREQWKGAAGLYVPAILGGDPSAVALAAEVQKFIADPKNLTLTATGKAGPVKLIELPGLKDPTALLKKVNLTAAANK